VTRYGITTTRDEEDMADTMSIDNKPVSVHSANGSQSHHQNHQRHHHDSGDESLGSSPEGDDQIPSAPAGAHPSSVGQDGQQPKRKGGRKPVSQTIIEQLPSFGSMSTELSYRGRHLWLCLEFARRMRKA
jgi:hypothetical protein